MSLTRDFFSPFTIFPELGTRGFVLTTRLVLKRPPFFFLSFFCLNFFSGACFDRRKGLRPWLDLFVGLRRSEKKMVFDSPYTSKRERLSASHKRQNAGVMPS
jgi:hypothetical protein